MKLKIVVAGIIVTGIVVVVAYLLVLLLQQRKMMKNKLYKHKGKLTSSSDITLGNYAKNVDVTGK